MDKNRMYYLRKIVARREVLASGYDEVILECGHIAHVPSSTIYRARCRHCGVREDVQDAWNDQGAFIQEGGTKKTWT